MRKLLFTIAAVASFTAMSAQTGTVTITGIANAVELPGDNVTTHTVTVDLPSIAIIDVHSVAATGTPTGEVSDITFSIAATDVNEAGLFMNVANIPSAKVRVNHTYVPTVASSDTVITVELDAAIPGFNLNLKSGVDSGAMVGEPGDLVILDLPMVPTTAVTVRNGILASYTLDGPTNGTELEYYLTEDTTTFGGLDASGTGVMQSTLTYTISAL
ncbi:hypothetical protein [Tenacibaculum haliotis]|uniref:hypothetical protein n=1 Tax=Tenacibaculum haliotis TaxID=1888914 RepID=UPI0021AF9460|nr:hypothetical protein [Tenacibaculum haliotis]MCT4700004.1 hypothetical protein [Tenacibaculum haliotis]